ncbi:nucleotide-binding domain containing protein [Streptomyces albidoflavus]
MAGLAAFAREQWRLDPARPPLFYAVDDLPDLERTTPPGEAPASVLIEEALAALAVALVDDGARRLLVAGGETSGAVVTALEVRASPSARPSRRASPGPAPRPGPAAAGRSTSP